MAQGLALSKLVGNLLRYDRPSGTSAAAYTLVEPGGGPEFGWSALCEAADSIPVCFQRASGERARKVAAQEGAAGQAAGEASGGASMVCNRRAIWVSTRLRYHTFAITPSLSPPPPPPTPR